MILPFRDQIIYDGFLQSSGMYFGPEMTWEYNQRYLKAKKKETSSFNAGIIKFSRQHLDICKTVFSHTKTDIRGSNLEVESHDLTKTFSLELPPLNYDLFFVVTLIVNC